MVIAIAEETFDVVVAGGGGAGLAAAIEACTAGRTVVLLEKGASLGGSTAWSVGSVTASATPYQTRKGIKDRPADHWREMATFNGDLDPRDNPDLRRVLADAMPDTFRWLLSHGIRFYGPMPEPPHRKPRMHNVLPNAQSFIVHLERAARRAGADIRLNTRAIELLVKEGQVVAVDCHTPAGSCRFRARGGVVLATGDFTNDPELKVRYMGPQEAKVDGVNVNATGDGQKLATRIGARIVNGDLALGPELRFIPPQNRNILLKLPPWQALANLMAWSLDHLPSGLLRPFVMSRERRYARRTGNKARHAGRLPHGHRVGLQQSSGESADTRGRALRRPRSCARGVRPCRGRARRRSRTPCPRPRRPPNSGALWRRIGRSGRPAAQGPRSSSGLGLRVGAPRRPPGRLRQRDNRYALLTTASPTAHFTGSSVGGAVVTMNTRSVRPLFVIECSTPGGRKMTSCLRTTRVSSPISINPSPSSTW